MKRASFSLKIIMCLFLFFNAQAIENNQVSQSQKFKLITILYNETNPQRMQEYVSCLEQNLAHAAIDEIYVIYDVGVDDGTNSLLTYLKQKPVKISYVKGRPTFGYCFDMANATYPNCKIILSNADIYFNDTLFLLKDYGLENKFLALTRWDVTQEGNLELFRQYTKEGNFNEQASYLSQDVWIFQTPLKKFINPNFQMGTWACDGYIAYQAYISGLDIINPCLTIQACHLHLSRIRHWVPQSIPGAKALVLPWVSLNT